MKDDKYFLKEAIKVGDRNPAPYNFGAVVVKDGEIIAAEESKVGKLNDPSAHDGICAIRVAAQKLQTFLLDGATLYCAYEPCLMCVSCAYWANFSRVVYAQPRTGDFEYESKDKKTEDFAKEFSRTMKIERIDL